MSNTDFNFIQKTAQPTAPHLDASLNFVLECFSETAEGHDLYFYVWKPMTNSGPQELLLGYLLLVKYMHVNVGGLVNNS